MVLSPVDERTEIELVDLARAGDRTAFAALYDRYFDRIYDFAGRLMRDHDETADVVQDTFIKAMSSISGLKSGASFKSWLFTIARNTALGRLERAQRTRPLTVAGEDDEEVPLDVVDPDRFADPAQAAEASAMAALVWEAAAGLDPRQLSLLDLVVRQGLESAEIADVMGVSKNNAYVMVNRLKSAVEEAISAFIMLKTGRNDCAELDAIVTNTESDAMSPPLRRQVTRHINDCAECDERRRKRLSPLAVLGAFAPLVAPPEARGLILEQVTASAGGGSGGGGGAPIASGALSRGGGWLGRRFLFAAGATLAGIVALFIVLPARPLGDGDRAGGVPASDGVLVGGADESPTAVATNPAATPTPTPTPSPEPQATPSGAASPNTGASPTAVAAPSPEPQATPSVVASPNTGASPTAVAAPSQTPTPGASAAAGTPSATPPPTRTPAPPTATPTTCPKTTLTAQPANLDLRGTRAAKIQVDNDGCASIELGASSLAPWLRVSVDEPKVPGGSSGIVYLEVDEDLLQEGVTETTVLVGGGGVSLKVPVSYTLLGSPPVILDATITCVRSADAELVVTGSDDHAIASVRALIEGSPPVILRQTSGTEAKGTWKATLFGVFTSTQVEVSVTDQAEQETTSVVSCGGTS